MTTTIRRQTLRRAFPRLRAFQGAGMRACRAEPLRPAEGRLHDCRTLPATHDAAIAKLQQTMTDQSEGKAGVKSAGVEIEETMDQGMSVRRRMDAVVRNVYRDNAAVLAEWETASHIEQAPKKKKGGPEEPPK